MLLAPIIVFMITIPFSRWLKPRLRRLYLVFGGISVFCGSGISLYFAAYTGDQGGIAAYLFQMAVIVIYVSFMLAMASLNCLLRIRGSDKNEQ